MFTPVRQHDVNTSEMKCAEHIRSISLVIGILAALIGRFFDEDDYVICIGPIALG